MVEVSSAEASAALATGRLYSPETGAEKQAEGARVAAGTPRSEDQREPKMLPNQWRSPVPHKPVLLRPAPRSLDQRLHSAARRNQTSVGKRATTTSLEILAGGKQLCIAASGRQVDCQRSLQAKTMQGVVSA